MGLTMKKTAFLAYAALALVAGCSHMSPYDYLENWLIREDPVRPFAVPADVIYIQGELYADIGKLSSMTSYARSEVGKGRLDGIARVFAPLVASYEDIEKAVDWYFDHHYSDGRCIVFIGEGYGGSILKTYQENNSEMLREKGLVASFYSPDARQGFVTDSMVRSIQNAVNRARYRRQWGKEMPYGMLEEGKIGQ